MRALLERVEGVLQSSAASTQVAQHKELGKLVAASFMAVAAFGLVDERGEGSSAASSGSGGRTAAPASAERQQPQTAERADEAVPTGGRQRGNAPA